MQIIQKTGFQRAYRKLHANQKQDIDNAIRAIITNPALGQSKTGDLSHVRVYKFKMVNQLTLLAYTYHNEIVTLTLLLFGSHQNFYQDLKNSKS